MNVFAFPVEVRPGGYRNWRVRWGPLGWWVVAINLLVTALLYALR